MKTCVTLFKLVEFTKEETFAIFTELKETRILCIENAVFSEF